MTAFPHTTRSWAKLGDELRRLLAMLLLHAAFKVHGEQAATMCRDTVLKVERSRHVESKRFQ